MPTFQPARVASGLFDVVAPNRAAEAELQRIGALDRFLDGAVFQDGNDRPELLFPGETHVVRDVRDDRQRIEIARPWWPAAAGDDACPARASVVDVLRDFRELHRVRHRADQRLRIEPVADGDAAHVLREARDDRFVL